MSPTTLLLPTLNHQATTLSFYNMHNIYHNINAGPQSVAEDLRDMIGSWIC